MMEYQNERLILVSRIAHTRGRIDKAGNNADAYLLALLDQEEAALYEYDEQQKVKAQHESG